ncbi:MAG: NUDIX hydrolase [Chloroflexi bacterium]|nr:NUDIX hydrolase [Chloroflexota bacterium]
MATIICTDNLGNPIPVAPEALTFRPAVYGIFIENNQILLQQHPQTDLWHPPGTILAENETPTQVIRQTFQQLIGMIPKLGPMLFVEDQYIIDDERRAWHYSVLYYSLERSPTASAISDSSQTTWLPLDNLEREQMHFGYEAIQAGRLQRRL